MKYLTSAIAMICSMACTPGVALEPQGNPTSHSDIEMLLIKGKTFEMGVIGGEFDEGPVHEVTLSDFYIGKYEVTVDQYRTFATETGRSMPEEPKWGWKGDHPVVNTSWNDAQDFAKWLSRKSGDHYRLPTEAEWYFVASGGGTQKTYPWGNGKPSANVADESAARNGATRFWKGFDDGYVFTAPVGSFGPNKLGVHDIGGNVAEWNQNFHYTFTEQSVVDPTGPATGRNRVFKGGSFTTDKWYCRIAQRNFMPEDFTKQNLGFRVVMKKKLEK